MAYQYWSYDILHRLCMDAFQKFGFTEKEADIIQDVLLTSDLYGIESHGMQRMVRYHNGIRKGMIQVAAKPEVVFETPISAGPENKSCDECKRNRDLLHERNSSSLRVLRSVGEIGDHGIRHGVEYSSQSCDTADDRRDTEDHASLRDKKCLPCRD